MTSHQQRSLDLQDVLSLTFLAIRYPEWDRKLLDIYTSLHRHAPRDKGWHIDAGPATNEVKDTGVRFQVKFKFGVQRYSERRMFELVGHVDKVVPINHSSCESLLVATGTLWMWGENDRDNIKVENVSIPCYYNSHTRKGFGLVPMITSYEVYGINIGDMLHD